MQDLPASLPYQLLMQVNIQPLGDLAARVEFGQEMRPAINRRIQIFCAALEGDPVPGVIEWVPAYATVAIYYQPWVISFEALCRELQMRLRRRVSAEMRHAKLIELPVVYGGEFGPDLEDLARARGLTVAQAIRRHSQRRYLVYMIGFLPGFAYLGAVSSRIAAPRHSKPRPRVLAGSVGIAGVQTGIYPCDSPGGWQIIGRTPLTLYDPHRQPPGLLAAGDSVKFVPVHAN